ncbi:hypothetical protein CDD81_5617 [Ophiocordyceps australis]|uniref:Condensation domain-containing protein n=1 Tax=Ophiocordyceps australis TaxID=1399860 RepID=A0A2C5Y7F4_9HYPO|nr:hypothetical protein CDD81_5617 [Ophiocordyceps australis]
MTPCQPAAASRPLGNMESLLLTISNKGKPFGGDHMAMKLVLHLDFVDSVDRQLALRRAWQALHRQYPALGTTLEPREQAAHKELFASTFDAHTWDKATFVVLHELDDANSAFEVLGPSPTPKCHWLPASSEVLIQMSHWRIDGMGIFMLAHRFLTALAEILRRGPETCCIATYIDRLPIQAHPLPPTLDSLAQEQKRRVQNPPDLESAVDRLVGGFFQHIPSIVLPTRADACKTLPTASGHVTTRLDVHLTRKIFAARRAKGYSFTAAVHAALVRTTAKFPQHPFAKTYASWYQVDVRKLLAHKAGFREQDGCPFGVYISAMPICVNILGLDEGRRVKCYDEIAREMTLCYSQDLSNILTALDGGPVGLLDIEESWTKRVLPIWPTPRFPGYSQGQAPELSSLGRLDRHVRHQYDSDDGCPRVVVKDAWVGVDMVNEDILCHVWAWKDQLHLGASFNQSFFDKEFIAEVLSHVMNELLPGLGVRNSPRSSL